MVRMGWIHTGARTRGYNCVDVCNLDEKMPKRCSALWMFCTDKISTNVVFHQIGARIISRKAG